VRARTREPGGDGRLPVAKDAFRRGRIQPFSQRREYDGDLMRGSFQPVQGRIASSCEGGAAGLAAKGLDPFSLAMLAIADEGMDLRIGDAEVQALLVRTGVPLGVDSLGCSPPAFDLRPGTYRIRR
jgi:hypothetical protein